MKKKLELVVMLNARKKLEFKQSMEYLSESLPDCCSEMNIEESEDGDTFRFLIRWESSNQMRLALRSKEFSILIGAIKSLSKNTIIRLDDKDVGSDLSKLMIF